MAFMNLPVANITIDLCGLIILAVIVVTVLYKANNGSFHHFDNWHIFDSPQGETKKLKQSSSKKSKSVASSIIAVLLQEVFTSRVLGTCSKIKRLSHVAIFWGFVLLAVSTTLAFLTNPHNLILPLYNPVKLSGNAGGILIILGFIGMFYARYRERLPIWRLTRSDFFLIVLFLSVLTGFVTQQAIYSNSGVFWISSAFWLHMILVILLFATAPFTKFFHSLTKPVSLLHEEIDRRSGRELALPKE